MIVTKWLTLLFCLGTRATASMGVQNLTSASALERVWTRSRVRFPTSRSYGKTSSPLKKQTTSSPPVQKTTETESVVETLLTNCNKSVICDIKWKSFIPYVFYVYSGYQSTKTRNPTVSPTITHNLTVFNRLNFTRLNNQMHFKGDAAVIAGNAIIQTGALFNGKFKFVIALYDVLHPTGFSEQTRKHSMKVYNFVKKGNFDMAWKDFSAFELRRVRQYTTRKKVNAFDGYVETGDGEAKVTVKNATKPSLKIRMRTKTVKIKYGVSRVILATVSNNPFGNFLRLSQMAKNAFGDIYGSFAIFFIHESSLLGKGCFTDKLFTFDQYGKKRHSGKRMAIVEPKTISDIVDVLQTIDKFDLFETGSEFCRPKPRTTVSPYFNVLGGLGPW